MAEIQDSEFLRILRENPIVPQDEVRSAQEAQRDELDRRLAALDTDPTNVIPWEDVEARARARFGK